MSKNQLILNYIQSKLNSNSKSIPSLHKLASMFNTSKSQITRVLKKANIYDKYLQLRKESHYSKEEIKIGFMSDIHLGHEDKKSLDIALEYLKDKNIDVLILGGDVIDFESISFWKNKNQYSLVEELEMAKQFLKELRKEFPDSVIYYIEANHEQRAERYLISKAKEFSYLDDLSIPNLLKLSELDIFYISQIKHIEQNQIPFHINNLIFLHGHEVKVNYSTINIARSMFLKTQANIIFGHFHTTQSYYQRNILNQIQGAWSVGSLCHLHPQYSPINNWNNGFAYIETLSPSEFQVFNFRIHNNKLLT